MPTPITASIRWNKSGNKNFLIPFSDGLTSTLAAAIYEVGYSQDQGFHLVFKHTSFSIPEKIYNFNNNDMNSSLEEIFLTRFKQGSSNLGVLLLGEKGTGKSLLLKQTANLALLANLPVIMVENSFSTEALANYLSSIPDECVVMFDEFEKKFEQDGNSAQSQSGLLSFMDGTSINKKLIVLTANDEWSISPFFINRPSRIRYCINYTELTREFIEQFLQENLLCKEAVETLLNELDLVESVNFDLLNAIVNEINIMYPDESIKTILKILNIKRDQTDVLLYETTFFINGENLGTRFERIDWDYIPNGDQTINTPLKTAGGTDVYRSVRIKPQNLVPIKGKNQFVYKEDNVEFDYSGEYIKADVRIEFIRVKQTVWLNGEF